MKQEPHLTDESYIAADGTVLSLQIWKSARKPKVVILALHGINDYSRAFEIPAPQFAAHDVAFYAYDQRGFGKSPRPGIWAGTETLTTDLKTVSALLRARYPDTPLFWLGESMGGGIVITAATQLQESDAAARPDGLILTAPGTWGWDSMRKFDATVLRMLDYLVPGFRLAPPRELGIWPTDNLDVLRGLANDPFFLRATRIDTIYGVVDMMTVAERAVAQLRIPALVLYGRHEQVIGVAAVNQTLKLLPRDAGHRVAIYPDGWHMLLRDTQRDIVIRDVLAWINDRIARRTTPLPGGFETGLTPDLKLEPVYGPPPFVKKRFFGFPVTKNWAKWPNTGN